MTTEFSEAQLQQKGHELRQQLIKLLEQFGSTNPGLPVHVMMGALGEVLIQFSASHSSVGQTMILLGHLQDVVAKFKPAGGPPPATKH